MELGGEEDSQEKGAGQVQREAIVAAGAETAVAQRAEPKKRGGPKGSTKPVPEHLQGATNFPRELAEWR
eukprot:5039837-Alexandrium_andersonii.AAC.1